MKEPEGSPSGTANELASSPSDTMGARDDEDAAAVVAVLLALRSPAGAPTEETSRWWGRPQDPAKWTPGSDAWWASGLAG